MKTALILHGVCPEEEFFFSKRPSPSNAWWLPWLQQQFLRAGWQCQTPGTPASLPPVLCRMERNFRMVQTQKLSLLVGHGAGAGFAVKYMQERRLRLEKLLLVAPWLDPEREFDVSANRASPGRTQQYRGSSPHFFGRRQRSRTPNQRQAAGRLPANRFSRLSQFRTFYRRQNRTQLSGTLEPLPLKRSGVKKTVQPQSSAASQPQTAMSTLPSSVKTAPSAASKTLCPASAKAMPPSL